MIEGRNPLAAYMRASIRSHDSQSHTKGASVAVVRKAWNAFSRLLDIDFSNSFTCPLCGSEPSTVICDGTMLGFRKDLIPHLAEHPSQSTQPAINGSCHRDRVLLRTPRSRELLLKYSGVTRDRKKPKSPKQLTQAELKSLCGCLHKDGFIGLEAFITRLNEETGMRTCPEEFRDFLSELARNSPACGLMQLTNDGKAEEILERLIQNTLHLRDSTAHQELATLQAYAPLIADFVCSSSSACGGQLPSDMCSILEYILDKIRPVHPLPLPTSYPAPRDSKWSCFPSLPTVRGKAKYTADGKKQMKEADECRKASQKKLSQQIEL